MEKGNANSCSVTFSVVESAGTPLTKGFRKSRDGGIEAHGLLPMTRGQVTRREIDGTPAHILEQLNEVLGSLKPTEAIICAPPPPGRDNWKVRTADEEDPENGTISRAAKYFQPTKGASLLCLDLDIKDYPAEISQEIERAGGLTAVLAGVFEDIASAACIVRPSASAHVGVVATGVSKGSSGEHRYFVVPNGEDAAAFARRLADRLVLAGWGWGKVTGAGTVLIRTLIDTAASASSRLCYEADAILEEGLAYLNSREGEFIEGGSVRTEALPELTDEERERLSGIQTGIRAQHDREASERRSKRLESRKQDLVARGMDETRAAQLATEEIEQHELSPDFEVHLDSGKVVTVREITANRREFADKTCADPFEPDYGGGRNLAIIQALGSVVTIISQAHGGQEYLLRLDPHDFFSREEPPCCDDSREPTEQLPPLVMGRLDPLDLDNIRPREWLYGRKISRGYTTFIASPGGVGKTAYATSVALACASGKDLIGDKPVKPLRVWVFNLEDDTDEMRRRFRAALDHHHLDRQVLENVGVNSGRDRGFSIVRQGKDGDFHVLPDYRAVVAEMKRNRIDLLVVDPFLRSHQMPENSNEAQDEVMRLYAQIAHETQAGVVLLHHVKKGAVPGDMDSLRGGSTQGGGARSVLTLSPMTAEEAKKQCVEETQRRLYVRIDDAKNNMAPPAARAEWMKLHSVSLDNGTPDYPQGDSVQVAAKHSPPEAWDGLSPVMEQEMLRAIEKGNHDGERYSPRAQDKGRWAGSVLMEKFKRNASQAQTIIDTWQESGMVEYREYRSEQMRKGRKGLFVVGAVLAEPTFEDGGVFG